MSIVTFLLALWGLLVFAVAIRWLEDHDYL